VLRVIMVVVPAAVQTSAKDRRDVLEPAAV